MKINEDFLPSLQEEECDLCKTGMYFEEQYTLKAKIGYISSEAELQQANHMLTQEFRALTSLVTFLDGTS